jgi:hypothetical protein
VSERLARAVALGPGGVGTEQRYWTNRERFAETGTPWVRLWADWPRVQPDAGQPPDLRTLDAEVDAARADGLKVMLTAWRFARWANGTATVDDTGFELPDRVGRDGDPSKRKDLTFRFASDLSPAGAWGRWIDLLIARYSGRIDALEILNEPNLQLWPQQGASRDPADPHGDGPLTVDHAVATMIATAATIARRHPRPPLLVAPATGDPVGDSRLRTGYDTFTRALLTRLSERGFVPGAGFAWSHHNYADVEGDLAGADNRVGRVRSLLTGRWAGWPRGDAADPGILVTESGAQLNQVARAHGLRDATAAARKQAELIERGLRRMAVGPEGAGVAMVCHYLFISDINFDSGLCDLDGSPRPAYYAWAQLPTLP